MTDNRFLKRTSYTYFRTLPVELISRVLDGAEAGAVSVRSVRRQFDPQTPSTNSQITAIRPSDQTIDRRMA